MFTVCILALFCWVSAEENHSAPPSCENLVQPLDHVDFHHVEGGWALVAGSLPNQAQLEVLKSKDSVAINFANSSDATKFAFTRVVTVNGTCEYMNAVTTLEGSTFHFDEMGINVTLLKTSCADCVVMDFARDVKKHQRLYLFSRKREVEQKEMEEFKAQAACLNLTLFDEKDPSKELCPLQISIDPAAKTEEKTEEHKA